MVEKRKYTCGRGQMKYEILKKIEVMNKEGLLNLFTHHLRNAFKW